MSGKNFAMLSRSHWAVLCSPAQQTGKYTFKGQMESGASPTTFEGGVGDLESVSFSGGVYT